jgi:hypothetical protein
MDHTATIKRNLYVAPPLKSLMTNNIILKWFTKQVQQIKSLRSKHVKILMLTNTDPQHPPEPNHINRFGLDALNVVFSFLVGGLTLR